ncbi:hypothetical protein [Nocardia xishanensis]|uniref:Uncharacterized protein n=1 Tax=Nocardia xishanensis TaxID=238964 RepID=A0ABW7XCI3_9NOCA
MDPIPGTLRKPRPYDWPELPAIEGKDEWIEGRRYLGLDVLARTRGLTNTTEQEETTPAAITA